VLVTPVDEKFLIDGSQSFSAFNALAFKNMVYDAKHFTCVKDIDSYHNKLSAWVYLSHICEIVRPIIDSANDGCFCNSCKEWYYMAISNQPDGTMICYSCRSNPLRMFY
jgi:hypothetical protein